MNLINDKQDFNIQNYKTVLKEIKDFVRRLAI